MERIIVAFDNENNRNVSAICCVERDCRPMTAVRAGGDRAGKENGRRYQNLRYKRPERTVNRLPRT